MGKGKIEVTVETTTNSHGELQTTVDARVDEESAPAARAAAAAAADAARVITEHDQKVLKSLSNKKR